MKILLYILLLNSLLYTGTIPKSNYILDAEQIKYLSYKQGTLIIGIKKPYWEPIFAFTKNNKNKKVDIQIADIHLHPHISEVLFNVFQVTSPTLDTMSKKLKYMITQKPFTKASKTDTDTEITFLESMLQKYPNSYDIRHLLIGKYYKKHNIKSSKLCINTYENTHTQDIKDQLSRYDYAKIYGCCVDLNAIDKGLDLLKLAQKSIEKQGQYDLLQKEARLYQLNHQYNKAILLYQQSIDSLKKTDFFEHLTHIGEAEKREFYKLQHAEIEKIEKSIQVIRKARKK